MTRLFYSFLLLVLHLPNIRTFLCCCYCAEQYGESTGRSSSNATIETCYSLLFTTIRQSKVKIQSNRQKKKKTIMTLTIVCFYSIYRAREALRQCLPDPLRDTTFQQALKDDMGTKRCLGQLLLNLSDGMH